MAETPQKQEPDPKVLEAKQCLEGAGIPCQIAYGGHAILLGMTATYGEAKKVLGDQKLDVPVRLPERHGQRGIRGVTANPYHRAALQPVEGNTPQETSAEANEVEKPVVATPEAAKLMQLLEGKRIWHRLSEKNGNVVYVKSGTDYREAKKLRDQKPQLTTVSLFIEE
ncbi:hypothetical protein A2454_00615 [Candidatus Peribacteria bacterium RIFOXYC2_FULL_55_14]|nr:MAG: hypothetical protein UY90_C0067G0003 [Candidatus Peregrinibacteria bacterium GW2011_GWA2_54_9]OGJ71583.1 MAG: hypothetical protein A2198_05275 [Candidatus Peribacteria bacterium RIFOXYA1_FULL_56_14]OGJ72977.1 MAG: hypothetical protein A2217_06785 [Candidatus Peribacteria bacterium RIFOXYA2_FULL_55_28]OGJ73966.1 MAG: hypothetical protein A2384_05055 [Candidatus Peribacteria bacterium RIFOXYB1_FULL_54_35]OGJ76143.1 MAG: hypothetical protein A2327_04525 [Candidatus Peribacteria bacterium R